MFLGTLFFIEHLWWLLLNPFNTGAIQGVKSVQIRSFPRSVSFLIPTQYQKIRTRKNLFGHFSPSNCEKDFCRKQPVAVFCKKGVYEIFANFTGKHLFQSIVLLKNIYSEEHLRKTASVLLDAFKLKTFLHVPL